MLGDVEAERLLLELQQVALLELAGRDRRMVLRARLLDGAEVEDRALAREPVGLLLLSPRERLLQQLEHAAPRRGVETVERAALDERLERTLVHELAVDALGEVPDRRERSAFLARTHDRER